MKYGTLLSLFLVITSCSLDSDSNSDEVLEPVDFRAENEVEISEYLTANDLVSQTTESGLHFIIENQGDGAQPTANDVVTVVYSGFFTDGTVFDESSAEGITIGLNQVIPGWTEGIPLLNVGGSGTLLIPAHLGYGSFDFNGIPGGSVLLFDVELLAVN